VCLGRGGVSDSDDGGWSLRGLGSYGSLDLWVRPLYSILLMSGFVPFRVLPFGCSCPFQTSFALPTLPCALRLVLATSASTVSSAFLILALLSIGLVVNAYPLSYLPFPNPFLSYLAFLSYRSSIYSLDDGRTRDSKS
jgi:hypothetical protein